MFDQLPSNEGLGETAKSALVMIWDVLTFGACIALMAGTFVLLEKISTVACIRTHLKTR